MHINIARRLLAAGLVIVLGPGLTRPAHAQGAGLDFTYGRWWPDSSAMLYNLGYHHPLLGPLDWGAGLMHLQDTHTLNDHTQTGAELTLGIDRAGHGPYAVGSTGLAFRHADGSIDASWSAGLGWAWQPLGFFSLALELRYRVEDQGARGFWRLQPTDRRGFVLLGRLAIGSPRYRAARPGSGTTPAYEAPSETEIERASRAAGAAPEAVRLAADIVETALSVMGTPYSWGGTDANGYDCSGLIQYAYEQHGIIVPRVSRDQMRMGRPVEARIDAVRPGDILGFSVEGDRVTHVGLYVGNGEFIHAAAEGVKLSSLAAPDGDSVWWQRHWVAARRIVQ